VDGVCLLELGFGWGRREAFDRRSEHEHGDLEEADRGLVNRVERLREALNEIVGDFDEGFMFRMGRSDATACRRGCLWLSVGV
jgi:hypothetical protein